MIDSSVTFLSMDTIAKHMEGQLILTDTTHKKRKGISQYLFKTYAKHWRNGIVSNIYPANKVLHTCGFG